MRKRLISVTVAWLVPGLLLLVLEIYSRTAGAGSDSLAPPSDAVRALIGAMADGSVWQTTTFTLSTAAIGLLFGSILGLLLGIVLGLWPHLRRASFLSVEILRAVPAIALIPLSMLVFGFGSLMEISIVAFATFWPVLIFTESAVCQIDAPLLEVSRLYGFGIGQRTLKIILPAMTQRLLMALRFAIGMALIAATTVEITANPYGLGYAIMFAQQSLNPALMIGWLIWIGLIGYALQLCTVRLERSWAQRMGA